MAKIKFIETPGNPDETIYIKIDNLYERNFISLSKKLEEKGYLEKDILFIFKNILLKNKLKYKLSFNKKTLNFIYSIKKISEEKLIKLIEKESSKTKFETKIVFKDDIGFEIEEFKPILKKMYKKFKKLEAHGCLGSGEEFFNGFIKNIILFDPDIYRFSFSFDKEVLTLYEDKAILLDLINLAKNFVIGSEKSKKYILKKYANFL